MKRGRKGREKEEMGMKKGEKREGEGHPLYLLHAL